MSKSTANLPDKTRPPILGGLAFSVWIGWQNQTSHGDLTGGEALRDIIQNLDR